jgi:ADP-dependent NAD(P)H-hydrate dehydratase
MLAMDAIDRDFLRTMPLPEPPDGGKEERGNVLIIGGSREVPGGAMLAGIAALRSGAGRIQIATHQANASLLAVAVPEARVIGLPLDDLAGDDIEPLRKLAQLAERADAVLVGPGLAAEISTAVVARAVLSTEGSARVIFDAGAIKTLRKDIAGGGAGPGKVHAITPHAGEMAGLMDAERSEVEADMPGFARRAASELGTAVALKGAQTFVCHGGRTVLCDGHVGLATSGSGDVLAGLIAGLVARGAHPFDALCWGVYVHAEAGRRLVRRIAPMGFLARELLDEIPRVLCADLSGDNGRAAEEI